MRTASGNPRFESTFSPIYKFMMAINFLKSRNPTSGVVSWNTILYMYVHNTRKVIQVHLF